MVKICVNLYIGGIAIPDRVTKPNGLKGHALPMDGEKPRIFLADDWILGGSSASISPLYGHENITMISHDYPILSHYIAI